MCYFGQSGRFSEEIERLIIDDIKISSGQEFLSLPDIGTNLL